MGYRIIYNNHRQRRKQGKFKLLNVLVVAFILLIVVVFVSDISLSGYRRIAGAALSRFADDLKSGESVQQAVTAFCQEISNYAIYAG